MPILKDTQNEAEDPSGGLVTSFGVKGEINVNDVFQHLTLKIF
jgi:hypothetical protein